MQLCGEVIISFWHWTVRFYQKGCKFSAKLHGRGLELLIQNPSFRVKRSMTRLNHHVTKVTWPWLHKGTIQSEQNDPVVDSGTELFSFFIFFLPKRVEPFDWNNLAILTVCAGENIGTGAAHFPSASNFLNSHSQFIKKPINRTLYCCNKSMTMSSRYGAHTGQLALDRDCRDRTQILPLHQPRAKVFKNQSDIVATLQSLGVLPLTLLGPGFYLMCLKLGS